MNHRKIYFSILILFAAFLCKAQSYKFDFGSGKVQKGYTQILPETNYSPGQGYGFEFSSNLTSKTYDSKDALTDDYITADKPFYFSVKLPEGNYNVKVVLGDKQSTSTTTIKAECRRLMIEKAETTKGKFTTQEFTVHIRDSVIRSINSKVRLKPREFAYLHWDDKLTLEFNNTAPKVCAVEITPATDVTTVFLAGNSNPSDFQPPVRRCRFHWSGFSAHKSRRETRLPAGRSHDRR